VSDTQGGPPVLHHSPSPSSSFVSPSPHTLRNRNKTKHTNCQTTKKK
jgi:hypothetical protein